MATSDPMTPEIITALRALPPLAHAALLEVGSHAPGWALSEYQDDWMVRDRADEQSTKGYALVATAWRWLPADPCLVMAAAARVAGVQGWALRGSGTGAVAYLTPLPATTMHRAADPMLAALAVLADVCR